MLVFIANVAQNRCHQGNESYNELICKCSTATAVGSDSKLQYRHRSSRLYVIHSLNKTVFK